MIRLLFKVICACTLLFALCITLIRAQPRNDGELRTLLTPPEGCPAPCFMGIRPGVTTVDEAIEILERHEWVAVNDVWTWNGGVTIHFEIQESVRSENPSGQIIVIRNLVDEVRFNMRFRDVFLTLGSPNAGEQVGDAVSLLSGEPIAFPYTHVSYYFDFGFRVDTASDCKDFWERSSTVYVM